MTLPSSGHFLLQALSPSGEMLKGFEYHWVHILNHSSHNSLDYKVSEGGTVFYVLLSLQHSVFVNVEVKTCSGLTQLRILTTFSFLSLPPTPLTFPPLLRPEENLTTVKIAVGLSQVSVLMTILPIKIAENTNYALLAYS